MTKKTIGLALSGGGARGFAHIGVLKALEANGIFPDVIAGTSAGSAVGAFAAGGMAAADIETITRGLKWSSAVRPAVSPMGFFSNKPLGAFLKANLNISDFSDMKVTFAAVAYDIVNGEEAVITEGDVSEAVRASCAVPGIFTPVRTTDGRILVDGAVTAGLPVDQARALGANIVIGVDLIGCGASFRAEPKTAFGVMLRSALTLIRASVNEQRMRADVVIEPQIAHIRPDQMTRRRELIDLGEEAAMTKIGEIRKLTAASS